MIGDDYAYGEAWSRKYVMAPALFTLETAYPVALDSVDHEHPHGTANDNTHWPPFVIGCERLFVDHPLSFLDMGCAGGGLVRDFLERGHDALGLEGSDYSMVTQRAEWKVIPDRLFTCDISKPFRIRDFEGAPKQFHVISAWDVLEHIPEESLATFFANAIAHLKSDGLFTGTVSTRPAKAAPDGRNYHATVKDKGWWTETFRVAGFVPKEPEPFAFEDYPRGNGNNYPANFALQPDTGFFFNLTIGSHR